MAYEELEALVERTPRASSAGDAQPAAGEPRGACGEFDVRPNRELGQNFLIDDNLLRRHRRAPPSWTPDDVVLEVGGGLGVLSEYLAPRVATCTWWRSTARSSPRCGRARPVRQRTLHLADAVELDLGELDPLPGKVVANLPYGVAATVLLKSLEELPGASLLVAMVQREVAERLAAAPGHEDLRRHLGARAARVRRALPAPRPGTVFHPEPNVESALVVPAAPRPGAARRSSPRWCTPAFAHRRKALAGSLALAPGAPEGMRDARPGGARASSATRADARAERLSPADFARLAASSAIGSEPALRAHERAPAKVNLVLHVGRPRAPDGLHELCSLFASLDLADE